jgi:magnesium transporter
MESRYADTMSIRLFEKSPSGPLLHEHEVQGSLDPERFIWVDLIAPDGAEIERIEASFGVDAPSEHERAALEESARFYIENNVLVLNATVMAKASQSTLKGVRAKAFEVAHRREIVSFFLTSTTLITVRPCPIKAFEVNAGRASANLTDDRTAGDVLVSLMESLVERAADFLGASAGELEDLSVKVLIGHKQLRLETILRRLGQLGAAASQTRDSLASLARLVRFTVQNGERFNLPAVRMGRLATDIDTLQRQVDALKTDLTFVLESTLGLVSARQNDTLRAMAVVTLIFVPPTLIASAFGMNFDAMTVFAQPYGPWLAFGLMAASSALIITIARWGKWL